MKKSYVSYIGIVGLLIAISAIVGFIGFTNPESSTREQTIYGSGFELSCCDDITEKDVYELCLRIRDDDPEEFEAILLTNKLHQHTGPNTIYGAKMALYANRLIDGKPHQISVLSEAGTQPPISCLNDGIMAAIGSTYGRGLISTVENSSVLAATFGYGGRVVRLEVKPDMYENTRDYIANAMIEHGGLTEGYFTDVRKMGLHVWENMSQEDLFIVTYPDNTS